VVAKVGHRQTPYKQQSPPPEGFVVSIALWEVNCFDKPVSISDNARRFEVCITMGR
jgi:hypothetical protein